MNRDPASGSALALREYVGAVVPALETPVRLIDCDVRESPATVVVLLDAVVPSFPDLDWLLTWDEVNGWASRVRTDEHGATVALSFLGQAVLPSPDQVGRFVRAVIDDEQPGRLTPPEFRAPDAPDDLEMLLSARVWTDGTAPSG